MNLSTRLAVASLALAGLLSACTAMSAAADAPSLEGTAWVLSSLAGRALVPGATPTLRFEGGRVGGSDGCNRFSAPYKSSGGTLEVQPSGAATMMACPPETMEQSRAFMSGLTGARSYRVVDGKLQLVAADGAVLARFAPQSQQLAGTSWNVTGYNNGKQAVVSVLHETTLTLAFADGGKVSGAAGCNNFMGTYQASGSSLTFGPAAATRKMCAQEGVMQQEQQFLRALETVATASQEGNRLELRRADGALAVSLAREPAR